MSEYLLKVSRRRFLNGLSRAPAICTLNGSDDAATFYIYTVSHFRGLVQLGHERLAWLASAVESIALRERPVVCLCIDLNTFPEQVQLRVSNQMLSL